MPGQGAFLCCLVGVGIALASSAITATGPRTEDLVGVWHFDEPQGSTVLDATPFENDGEILGAVRTEGRFAGALQFDGKNAYARLNGVGALPEATIEVWVRPTAPAEGQATFVSFGRAYGGRSDLVRLGVGLEGGQAGLPGVAVWSASQWVWVGGTEALTLGTWYHLAAVLAPDGCRFYVNGRLAGRSDAWRGGLPAHEAILLGACSWGSHAACLLDELRLYRRALSAAEVARHYKTRAYVARPPQPKERRPSVVANINAADFYSLQSPTSGIQEAIAALPRRGGVVYLPPGTYVLRRAVRLPSGVVLRGSGAATVLKRVPQVRRALQRIAKPGDVAITVEDTTDLRPGDEIAILDQKQRGWYIAHVIVTRAQGQIIEFQPPLTRDYDPERGAVALNYFPGIYLESVHHAGVEDLCLDGDLASNPGPESDFTLAAIHLFRASDCTIRNCVVRGWPSDGIGVQGGSGNRVAGCLVEGCRGHGFHPGTSIQSSIFSGNIGRRNAWDGLFFCMNCRYVVVSDSVFEGNGWNGIGGLGNGGDKYNVVSGNVCVANGRCGILANDGDNNSIVGNICLGNSRSQPGKYPGIHLSNVTHMTVTGNRCLDDQEEKTQSFGIEESGTSDHNLVSGNHCRGNALGGVRLVGQGSLSVGNME